MAGIHPAYLSRIEAEAIRPTIETCARVAAALGADLSMRVYPTSGPPIHDRYQARIVEALIRGLHGRWTALPEIPVQRPVRGVIDLVLVDRDRSVVVAVEVQSQVRRFEQLLRWARAKAEALPSAAAWRTIHPGPDGSVTPPISRLLVVRSTRTNRDIVATLARTAEAAYPVAAQRAIAALRSDGPWPGDALIWATADGTAARIMARGPPRS